MRSFKPTFRFAATFAIGLVFGMAIAFWSNAARPTSSLTKGLPSEWNAASTEFDARIRSQFPVGTPPSKLIPGLEAAGFKPTWFESDGEYGAERQEGNFVCDIRARVYWRAGKDGTVSAIRGVREEGCL